mgnify:CR=1 FL=1
MNKEMRERIWSVQERWFDNLLTETPIQGSADLTAAVRHQVLSGGKRIRAGLPLAALAHRNDLRIEPKTIDDLVATNESVQSALWLGLALELLHSGTLAHDDVMDGDKVRRNQPTVWVQFGIPQAINSGDILFYLAQECVLRAPGPPTQTALAIAGLNRSMQLVIAGQAIEMALRRDQRLPTRADYTILARGKTGGLFGLGLYFGLLSARVAEAELENIWELGLKLGQLFQVQDDILDLVGEKGRGSHKNDLLEGKPSWLITEAAQTLSPTDAQQLGAILYKPREETTSQDVETLEQFLEATQSLERGLEFIQNARQEISVYAEEQAPDLADLVAPIVADFLRPIEHVLTP